MNNLMPPSAGQLLDNGLTPEQNEQAVKAIQKLKVHDLSSIIASLNLRRPRANKQEQQRALYNALFEPNQSGIVWRMATQLSQPAYEQRRGIMPSANRNHPYNVPNGRNGTSAHMVNHLLIQQQLMQQQQQQHHQQHQQSAPVRSSSALVNAFHEQLNAAMAAAVNQRAVLTAAVAASCTSSGFPFGSSNHQQENKESRPLRHFAPQFEIVPLPFYDVMQTLLPPVELHASANGSKQTKTLQFTFSLTQDQLMKMYRNDSTPLPRYEVQLRFFNITDCGSCGPLRDEFPLNCNVRVDENSVTLPHVIPTNKPNVEPKRPSRPVNITPFLSRFGAVNHKITIDWLGDRRVWAATIVFVHRVNADILFNRIDTNREKHKLIDVTKREVCDKLTGAGEEDIAMDQLVISLLDPLIKSRMVTPSRCKDCTHLQCFDLDSYLRMNEKKPTWQCPVCSNYCPYDRLIVDDYFLDMLTKVDKNTTEVELKQDGSYDVIGVDDEVCLSDDDDDVKPVVAAAASSSTASAAQANGESQNGGKKKKPPVDDDIIVLSDDDDEELNRGIENSMKTFNESAAQRAASTALQRTPPRTAAAPAAVTKKSKSNDIEVITLDDTPPRPVAAPVRQMSLQQQLQHQPTPSSCTSSAMPTPPSIAATSPSLSAASTLTNLSDALAQIGAPGSSGGRQPPQQAPQHVMQQQQQQQHQPQHPQNSSHFQQAMQAAVSQQTASYGYSSNMHSTMFQQQQQIMQQQQQQQQQLIGRTNQINPMHPQQQGQPQMLPVGYFPQQAMANGGFYYQPPFPQQYRQN